MEPRKLEHKDTFAWEDIKKLIWDNDLSDPNTFLVLNGGTGVGKTTSVMSRVQAELGKKIGQNQSLLVVESRTTTVDQLNENFSEEIECINGIDVCQRLAFMSKINKNQIHYDWIVIDECHGLFSEASFAEDAEFIASWIRSYRKNTHIIFVTANDEYFEELSRKYFPGNFNFIYLFPDFTHYVSHTYVKEIQFIKTTKVDEVINTLTLKLHDKKGIIFLKKASDVKDWFFRLLEAGVQVGMIVSQANETNAILTKDQEKQVQDAEINISGGRAGLTMADLCSLYDAMRIQQGKESIRGAINKERLPDDIDILLATDTLQEGVSIKSLINYIIIEGFTEVEVRQKLGRFRGNLDSLYIIFNPNSARNQTAGKMKTFLQLLEAYNAGDQLALAQFYGEQKRAKSTISFVIRKVNSDGKFRFEINMPAFYNCENELNLYNRLVNNTEETVQLMYTYPLLEGSPKIISYTEDIRNFNLEQQAKNVAKVWSGIPLKGPRQEDFIKYFIENNITDKNSRKITTFTRACNFLREQGVQIKERQANQKDLDAWPDVLTKLREKFKIIAPLE